jgi:chemotaxis protein MotA
MMVIVGILFALTCVFGGYMAHHGSMAVFVVAWTEYIIIGGGAVGIFVASNGLGVTKQAIAQVLELLKPDPFVDKAEYMKLLVMMYQLFSVARRDGLLGLEPHMEDPHKSSIISKNHSFLHHSTCSSFFCDTMKVVISGGVAPFDLAEMMDIDLESAKAEAHVVPEAIGSVGDAMPAVGICACVLGVVITMDKIGGDAKILGQSVAVALVGTFLGVFAAYFLVAPVARALMMRHRGEENYMLAMKHALFSFARGESPITCVEFARRQIDPSVRPGFTEMEKALKAAKGT